MAGKADSSFWRELTEKHRALQGTHGMLRADRDYIVGSGEPAKWTTRGAASPTATNQFEILAKRGASVLPHAPGSDLRCVWLEAVSRQSANFRWDDHVGIEVNAGSEGAHHLTGTISRICEASADYCSEMEGKALEAEALDEEIRQLRSAPVEEIPESVTADPEKGLPKKSFATALGRNLNRLRLDAGWSYDEMAKATDIDKKLILGHVNKGKNANPGTLATYASVFTEKLGKPVTVAELEG